jgi:putative sugar O-methyltransferase
MIYRSILEHVSLSIGKQYMKEIERSTIDLNLLQKIISEDVIGGPRKYKFGGYGSIAPSTLRYIKVALDLEQYFGSLDNFSISEIGVGYGGQCRVINLMWAPNCYNLYDIPEALELTTRFLRENLISESCWKILGIAATSNRPSDLVISNYAFSELKREAQEEYFTKIIRHASRGYITYNSITPHAWKSMPIQELQSRIPGSKIVQEWPLTHKDNQVLVW